MKATFALGSFLARWGRQARLDLSASEAAPLTLPALLGMADAEDRQRWQALTLGYADPHGASWLRSEIATRYKGLGCDNILCSAGAQEGLACVVRAILGPRSHAVVVVPIYQPAERAVSALCATTGVLLERRDGWRLDLGKVAAAIRPETRLVLINFPNSPTGASIDAASLEALVALCRRHGLWLVNDEVYRTMADDPQPGPAAVAELYERGVSVNAVSKGFGLPGLRVGWVASPDRGLLGRVLLEKSGQSSCVAAPAEVLAHIALKAEGRIVEPNKALARLNRARVQSLLGQHSGVLEMDPPGNLAFAVCRTLGARDATGFAVGLVRETGVLLLPSGLWRTVLAPVPTDRLRIGLGAPAIGLALAALDGHLHGRGGRAGGKMGGRMAGSIAAA